MNQPETRIDREERDAELHEVPYWTPTKEKWPSTVRSIGIGELDNLGIDRLGNLYWDGKPIEVRRIVLSRGQKIVAAMIAGVGFVAALGAAAQGLVSAHSWLCELAWISQSWCPTPL